MADDMGWGQTGYRNHPVLKTPNLDAMAANGLRCERFYAGGPWYNAPQYQPYLEQWKQRWEYKSYLAGAADETN